MLLGEALLPAPAATRAAGSSRCSSVAALRGAGSYGAAKAAINSWVTGIGRRVAADGIAVNAVAPGFVPDTEFWEGRLDDAE